MEKIKLGIIGCGLAAKELHLPALMNLKDKFEIIALCNHTEPKAKELSDMLGGGIPIYLDYKKILNNKDIEAVDIALPIHLNYRVTKNTLAKGKNVIVEKPIAGNLSEAKKMLNFPLKYGKVMMVAENFRYRAVFNKVKNIIENDTIGKPYSAVWNIYFNIPVESKYAATEWRQHHQYPGGFMTDAGVHNIAALRLLFGEILSVNAFTTSINPAIGIPDTMSLQFNTKNIFGVYNLFFSVNGLWENKLLIFGDQGTIEVNENNIRIKRVDKDDEVIDANDDSGYYLEFTDFYNAVRKGNKVISNFYEGYKDLEVIMSALKSANNGKKILLR
jgi:predicted dehydrogenase